MVGCVIVHEDKIIGEGYHREFGQAHAEVNALASVKDERLLEESTLYVNLEPCSHFGKTPPCSWQILEKKIRRVVIGALDTNPIVAGNGLRQLEENGCNVESGILEKECLELNKAFYTYHGKKRPWILLKWAQANDGFIDRERTGDEDPRVNWISGPEARQLVHKWRAEVQSILVGTRTALLDDPELTVRDWQGKNPLRLVIDRKGILPEHLKLFNDKADTLVFTSETGKSHDYAEYITLPAENDYLPAILKRLYEMEVQSLMVEGGAFLLRSFINSGLWDEARVITGEVDFVSGIPAPVINADPVEILSMGTDRLEIFKNF
jgi:diaminohydroxyphosphoribosylaminopyrimidine deaminase/5-amino-6-(5-phosphoribosylamino)uracil reductase